MIHGMKIKLINKFEGAKDEFGNPIYGIRMIDVDNVIVAPVSTDDMINTLNLTGKRAVYTLGIPKGDTNNWEDAEVEFFGKRFRTFGTVLEGIEDMIPLQWNKKVMVEYVREAIK